MKRYFSSVCVMILAMGIGCTTMPEKVENACLVEMTPEQTAQITQIEQSIIKKREERINAEKALAVADELIAVSSAQLEAVEANGRLLDAQKKLYAAQESQDKAAAAIKNSDINKQRAVQEKANTAYLKENRELIFIQKELRELELAVLLAQADLIKAQAAFAFQTKRQEKTPIKVEQYQKYYDAMNAQLTSKKENEKTALDRVAQAKDALAKTGYGAQ